MHFISKNFTHTKHEYMLRGKDDFFKIVCEFCFYYSSCKAPVGIITVNPNKSGMPATILKAGLVEF